MIKCLKCNNTLNALTLLFCPICESRRLETINEGTFNTCSWCYRKYLVKSDSNNSLCSRCVKYISLELMEQVRRYTINKKELEIYEEEV